MTSTATAPATQSFCTEVINAADFSNSTQDVNRDTWTVGKMYHLIKALAGQPVIVTTDTQTGHTVGNVVLKSTFTSSSPRVRIRYTYAADGRGFNDTDHYLWTVGAVVVMPTSDGRMTGVKWEALESHRQHQSAAIAEARKLAEGTGREWGTWKATVISGREVDVTYTPSTGNPAFADEWGERGYWRINIEG